LVQDLGAHETHHRHQLLADDMTNPIGCDIHERTILAMSDLLFGIDNDYAWKSFMSIGEKNEANY